MPLSEVKKSCAQVLYRAMVASGYLITPSYLVTCVHDKLSVDETVDLVFVGAIQKWNGTIWSSQNSGTTQALYGVWGTDANNVWAVGDSGTILHYQKP